MVNSAVKKGSVLIWVERVPPEGERFEGELPGSVLDLDNDLEYRPAGDISYSLFVQVISGKVVARGKVGARVRFNCSRCLTEGARNIETDDFQVVREIEEGIESVDLTPDIRESIILFFSGYPVCNAGCRGLCSKCGRNLNEGECDCESVADDRWFVLDALELNKENKKNGSTKEKEIQKQGSDA